MPMKMMKIAIQGELLLIYPGVPLLTQVADWARDNGNTAIVLRILSSRDRLLIQAAVRHAAMVIVDATEQPGAAMAAVESAISHTSPTNIVVYTEQVHAGLELFTRVRGVALVVGPMSRPEWDVWLESLQQVTHPMPALRTDAM
jgi:hypothetical protein